MSLLGTYFFAPDAFDQELEFLPYLQPQRRGYDFFGGTEDPKLLESIERVQYNILRHLLHPTVLRRIENSSLYGNEYNIDEVVGDLSKQIFFGDLRGDINAHRQRLQTMYVEDRVYLEQQRLHLFIDSRSRGSSEPAKYSRLVKPQWWRRCCIEKTSPVFTSNVALPFGQLNSKSDNVRTYGSSSIF